MKKERWGRGGFEDFFILPFFAASKLGGKDIIGCAKNQKEDLMKT